MKTTAIGLCFALACLPGAGIAQTLTSEHMERLDTNDDGAVDQAEIGAFMSAAFDHLDANGDGSLSAAETEDILTPAQFATLDDDGNGGVSQSEFLAQGSEDVRAADKDGDRKLE
jgi:hypothetical protein